MRSGWPSTMFQVSAASKTGAPLALSTLNTTLRVTLVVTGSPSGGVKVALRVMGTV